MKTLSHNCLITPTAQKYLQRRPGFWIEVIDGIVAIFPLLRSPRLFIQNVRLKAKELNQSADVTMITRIPTSNVQ